MTGNNTQILLNTLLKKLSFILGIIAALVDNRFTYLGCDGMVFNATFNNISALSWQSVLLVEETEVP